MLWSYEKVGRGLDRAKTKNFLAQAIPDKIFGITWSNLVNQTGKEKFGMFLCVF